jgi:flagellar motor switch protein FliG
MPLSGREKATILLSLLGSDLAETIIGYLPEDLADRVTSSINHLPTPSPEAITSVLEEFTSFISLPTSDVGQRSIESSAENYAEQEPKRSPLDIIFYSQPKKVAVALSAERSSVLAFILSSLPAVQAQEVLSYMTDRRREIESLMKNIKTPPVSEKIRPKIYEILAGRIERLSESR